MQQSTWKTLMIQQEVMPPACRRRRRGALGLALALIGLAALASPAVRAQGAGRYYPPLTRIDLTAAPYKADKNGIVDASGPINQAIKDYAGTGAILYLPAGTYKMIGQINYANDNNANFVTLMGAGQSATNLKVPDNWGFGGYVITTTPSTNLNEAFGINISDLTVSVGKGNPNAGGIKFQASNQGTLANITVTRDETKSPSNPNLTAGGTGISLGATTQDINGPCLLKNVTVRGFQFGIDANVDEYSFTLEHITVSGQHPNGAGLRAGGAVLAVRDLKSMQPTAAVPGVILYSQYSHLALLSSTFSAASAGTGGNAIATNGRHFLVRGVTISSTYSDHNLYATETISDPPDRLLTLQSSTTTTLNLPIKETPDEWDNNSNDWQPVVKANPADVQSDDTAAINAAIQAAVTAGKSVIYFPRFYVDAYQHMLPCARYAVSSTIHIPAGIKYILGMGNQLDQSGSLGGNFNPMFSFEGGNAGSAVYFRDFRNLNYTGAVILWQDNTPRDLVLSHVLSLSFPLDSNGGGGPYNISYGTGSLYLEDLSVGSGWRLPPGQKVWARQLNPEDANASGWRSFVDNNGAALWILGFKTEGAGPWITTHNGGSTELFGALNFINTYLSTFPSAVPPYQVTDANASLDFGTTKNTNFDYLNYLEVTRTGTSSYLSSSQLSPRDVNNVNDSSRDAPLFVSTGP